ncbi:cardiolipin synthetase [Rhodobacteraceae bacterium THAF1]|uniref:phospholipase D-like domain-containing protein n=1 Tax=Palleronia sp. THAF1 TaxID=2587842 RepID=UPI000F41A439|nr:phospholipase D-like domain-containing protein [Palleronia sp. THAF1]QFU10207.1 cardiolipin synthetase [Palleronia sp. THAF1]VDC16888.1 cardiolipin synthetase [Rhodobacteraceae bacterium THAF1]
MTASEKPQLLITAEEAWPAFERAMLAAERRVAAGFRVFDPETKLRSEEGCAVGETWADLLVHVINKGVRFDLILSDFDPIVAPDMHQLTWATMRHFDAIRDRLDDETLLNVTPAMHPAQAGPVARAALWPRVWSELGDVRDYLNKQDPEERKQSYEDLPGTHPWLRLNDDGEAETYNMQPPPLHPVSHHQKLAVFDSQHLYIGGLDLNPRRYDSPVHRRAAEETWHDVQMWVSGPAAAVAEAHLDAMLDAVDGKAEPPEEAHGFCTTLSKHRNNIISMAPEVLRNSIKDRTLEQIGQAKSSIYFETQFFRDRELARAISDRGREVDDLELLVILPGAPEDVAFENRKKIDVKFGEFLQAECIEEMQDAFGDRCYFTSPAQRRAASIGLAKTEDRSSLLGAPLIYVHAKVSIFDRRSILVSSANLNSRSLHWDTEAGLLLDDPDFAQDSLNRSLTHWMCDAGFDPSAPLVPQVRKQAELDAMRQPDNRDSFLLPYDVRVAREFGMNIPGAPPELV